MSTQPTEPTPPPLAQRAVELADVMERLADAQAELVKLDDQHATDRAPLAALVAELQTQVDSVRAALAIGAGIPWPPRD